MIVMNKIIFNNVEYTSNDELIYNSIPYSSQSNSTIIYNVSIIVEYGARIPDVAFEIQNRVKKSVENMTGLKVTEVNVHVQGVSIETEKKQENNQEQENTQETDEA